MAKNGDGSWLLEGTQEGIDSVFAPQERALGLLQKEQKLIDDAFASSNAQALAPLKNEYMSAFYENQTDAQRAALEARGIAGELADALAPLTEAAAVDNAAAAALKAASARGTAELQRYEDARYVDGTVGRTRREILATAISDPALGVAAQSEARRMLRAVDVYETTALAASDPGAALNAAVERGIIPVRVQTTMLPDGTYSVQNATGPAQKLDARAMSAMFNDMMLGVTKNTDALRGERQKVEDMANRDADKYASAAERDAAKAAAALAAAEARRAASEKARADRRDVVEGAKLIKLANGDVWSAKQVRELLQQPEVQAHLADPTAATKLTPKTIATIKNIVDVVAKRPPAPRAGAFDPSVGVNGQRLVNPITGAPAQ